MEIFCEVQHFAVPDNIFRRAKNAYQDFGDMCRLPEVENPAEKVPLIVTGSDAEVHIDVLLGNYGIEDAGNPTGGGGACLSRLRQVDSEQLIHMNTLLVVLRRDGSYLRSELAIIHEIHEQLINVFNRNITHMIIKPVRRIQNQ